MIYKYFISTDDYQDINRYNETLEALKNNNIPYREFISTRTPYNWYINCDKEPHYINFDYSTKMDEKFFVSKVQPLYPNEAYLLKRRETDGTAITSIEKFIYNDVFKKDLKYAICFRYKSKEEIMNITRKLKTRVYLIGTFKGRQLAISFNKYIKGEISSNFILLEKQSNEYNAPGEFERTINIKGLKLKDYIIKYTNTPYIENGKYYPLRKNI